MRALVRLLLIFTCMKLVVSKPQHLQEQLQQHLDPLNEPQFEEYSPKDPAKRTIGSSRHYALGKHVGIHPSGFRYVLGYSPINVKYVPVIKPVAVLKPVIQQSIKTLWKPVVQPTRHYLPPVVALPRPVHHVDHGWQPIVKPLVPVAPPPLLHHPRPWLEEEHHVHPVVEEPVVPAVPFQPVPPLVPTVPVNPVVPLPAPPLLPLKPHLHNYFFFQTPIAKPALLPQVPLLHVARPQLPVLPLGATFPVPVLQHTAPGAIHLPSAPLPLPVPQHLAPFLPVHPYPAPPIAPVHHSVPDHHPVSVHHPVPVHPQPALVPFPAPVPPHPAALPPISVEFHGNRHLVPFAGQFPVTAVQSSVPLPFPRVPVLPPQEVVGRQPHALPLPPEIHTNFVPQVPQLHPVEEHYPQIPVHHHPQEPFNPEAAIQPGQTDLQVPVHLPHHPHFRQVHGFNQHPPAGSLEPQFPPFQSPGFVRPSISLEPPLTHGHS